MEVASDEPKAQFYHPSILKVIEQKKRVKERLSGIKHKIGVYSAKGGVGKTTTAVNIAYTLKSLGYSVGLLDADIDCPNLSMFLGIKDIMEVSYPLKPIEKDGIKILSTSMLVDEKTKPIIWRGPMIGKMIAEFFENADWGELDYLILDMPPGCLASGTFVLTSDNYPKPIEEIKEGEYVLSYNGSGLVKNRVIGNLNQGKQAIYKVRTANRTIFASYNHPFLKYFWTDTSEWKPLYQLVPGNRIWVLNCINKGDPIFLPKAKESNHNVYTRIRIPEKTNSDFMQVIGHFVGDGFIRINKTRNKIIGLRICEPPGSKFREKYIKLYKDLFGCNIINDGTMFGIDSKPLAKLFGVLNLYHSALEKRIPEWVFSLPLNQRRAFIQGYSEADGHIRHREKYQAFAQPNGMVSQLIYRHLVQDTVSIDSTNEILVRQLHELCQISGIRATNVRKRLRKGNFIDDGRLIKPSISFEFDYSLKFDDSTFKLARIKSIEFVGYKETYDLQLEDYHSFIGNGMIVHNTSDAPLSIIQLLDLDGFILVTTPQHISAINTIRSGAMARRLGAGLLGVIENMSDGKGSGGREVAEALGCEFLGAINADAKFNEFSDGGKIPVLEDEGIRNEYVQIIKKVVG